MGNTSENQEGAENQQDEIPRDTQFNDQNAESPSAHENQPSQANQINKVNQSEQQFAVMQGGEQNNIIQSGMQNIAQQISPEIQQNQKSLEYQINQQNQMSQEFAQNQVNQENMGYIQSQGGYEQNQGSYIQNQGGYQQYQVGYEQNQEGYAQNQEGYQEMEGNQEYIEGEEDNIEGEGDGEGEGEGEGDGEGEGEGEEYDGEENVEGQEIQDNEEMPDDEDQNELVNNAQINQQDDNQINKQSRSYQINKDGKIYNVNEETQQYQINSGDNNYHIKKEFKKTTKIEKSDANIPNYPINKPLPNQGQIIMSQENNSIRKNIKVLPQEGLPKVYDGYYDNTNIYQGRYTQYYSDIPRYMSFQRSTIKNSPKIRSSLNVVKSENTTELVEIPKSEYESYMGRETIFIGGGMATGEYKFRGQGIVITQAEVPEGKIIINEEDILKEINRRKNKPKKEKKIRYEVLDRFYAITEFDGIPIKKIEKVEQQQKQYEYEEQQKYMSSSKGNAMYQFSSKESQSQQMQSNNQSQQYQFYQSQFQSQSQSQPQAAGQSQFSQMQQMNSQQMQQLNSKMQQMNSQNQNMNSSQMEQMNIRIMQNQNQNQSNINNIKYKNLSLSSPSDNYSKYLFEQINKIRTDPQSYIGIIEDAKNNIIKDKNGRILYNGKIKIALTNGDNSFNDAINFLKTLKPMGKLEFNPYLTVELPKSENEIKYKNDLRLKVENMVNNGISIKSYWRDVIKDPEISFLMMIVDDNADKSGMRRKDLLDPNMKYIGINSIDINGTFVCYLTLSNE